MKRLITILIASFFLTLSITLLCFVDDFSFSNGSQWGFRTSPTAIHYSFNHGYYVIQQHANRILVNKSNQGLQGHHF
jgi:hypothetical protein